MKIMHKIKIIIIKKNYKEKTEKTKNKQKTNTITTNKTLTTDKTLIVEERKKNTYLLHPNCEKNTLSNMKRKDHVH